MSDARAHNHLPLLAGGRPPRILFVVNEDWMFWSHRLAVARAARDAGAEVLVATRVTDHGEHMRNEGFSVIPLPWKRGARNPLREASTLFRLARIFRTRRPDIVHQIGLKGALYGGAAALLVRPSAAVSTITGFGYVATSTRPRARVLRRLTFFLIRRVLDRGHAQLIVQNPDDADLVRSIRLFAPERVRLIRGSGVDVERFVPMPEPAGPVAAVLVARLVESKGVREFVAAARLLRERGATVRAVLVGDPDPENPDSITADELRSWKEARVVEWRSRVEDVAEVWRDAHIAVLPSYREGLPRTLLEAAACGRPLVATDVPGCRDLTRDGDNGILTPLGDTAALANAIERLAGDAALRKRMGMRAREIVCDEYADAIVVGDTLAVYRELLVGT